MKDDWKVIWCGLEGCEAARLANTQANRSKQAAQLSPGAATPALCLLCSGRGLVLNRCLDSGWSLDMIGQGGV